MIKISHSSTIELNPQILMSLRLHNIIQIHNNVLWDWQYSTEYSPHSNTWICHPNFQSTWVLSCIFNWWLRDGVKLQCQLIGGTHFFISCFIAKKLNLLRLLWLLRFIGESRLDFEWPASVTGFGRLLSSTSQNPPLHNFYRISQDLTGCKLVATHLDRHYPTFFFKCQLISSSL